MSSINLGVGRVPQAPLWTPRCWFAFFLTLHPGSRANLCAPPCPAAACLARAGAGIALPVRAARSRRVLTPGPGGRAASRHRRGFWSRAAHPEAERRGPAQDPGPLGPRSREAVADSGSDFGFGQMSPDPRHQLVKPRTKSEGGACREPRASPGAPLD